MPICVLIPSQTIVLSKRQSLSRSFETPDALYKVPRMLDIFYDYYIYH